MNVYRHSRCRGFSLLELVLVIAIVGILSAIAIPRMANAQNNYRVSAVARRIAADIALAKNRARALSTSQSVVFSLSQNQYQLSGMPDPDHPAATYTVNLSTPPLPVTLSAVSFTSTTLTFNGYGMPSSGGTITIQSGVVSSTITVDADTGRTSIQ